jgi:glutathione peroxidase
MELLTTAWLFLAVAASQTQVQAQPQCVDWLNHEMHKLHSSETVNLCQLTANKVTLIVNTASECGYTPQFKGLEALYQQYKDKGLVIVGFPSDTFMQEHDDAEKTAEVCYKNYGVTFPMVAASKVFGKQANPVFKHLNAKLGVPKWNFHKYLIDRSGNAIEHFGAGTKPDDQKLIAAIEGLIATGIEP